MSEVAPQLTAIERARRSQIISAAATCITQMGYRAASLTEISKVAGVGKGVLLYHFGSRDALMDALVRHVYTLAESEIGTIVRAQTTPKGLLDSYVAESFRFISQHREYVIALLVILSDGQRPSQVSTDAYSASLVDIANILAFGVSQGVFRPVDTQQVAKMIRTLIDVASYTLRDQPDADISAYVDETQRFIDAALLPIHRPS